MVATKSFGSWRLLWPALLLSSAGYVGLALWLPLSPNLAHQPAADILDLTYSLGNGLAYAGLLILLFVLLIVAVRGVWLRGVWAADGVRAASQTLLVILAVATLFGLPLVFAYPVNATDVFRYGQQGRISSLYEGNPFVEPLSDYPDDPLYPFAGEWFAETTPYGPVWESAAGLLAQVSPNGAYGTLVVFKGFGLALLLANSVVLWQLLANLPVNRRAAYVILWAWNPALLLTFVANGHNDALMLFGLLLGSLAIRRERPVVGLALIVVAVLTKPIALLTLPIFLLGELRKRTTSAGKARLLAGVTVAAVALTGLAFLPWAGRGGWSAAPLALVSRLTREASAAAGFSPSVFFYFAFEEIGLPVAVQTIGNVLMGLFLLFYASVLWQIWRGRSASSGVAESFAGYMIQALNFRIWYAAWPFPFLIQEAADHDSPGSDPMPYWLRVGFWFLLTTQLSAVIYGHVRVFYLDESHLKAHLIAVPFTFLLPLLLARWSWFPTTRTTEDRGHYSPTSGGAW